MHYFKRIYQQLLYQPIRNRRFRREIRAVYAGIRAHQDAKTSVEGLVYKLRRNIHRLEKGLIMRPRRDVFATEYIQETVDAYAQIHSTQSTGTEELQWAHDVLHEFFSTTGSQKSIDICRDRFNGLEKSPALKSRSIPLKRMSYPIPKISYEDFFMLCRRRRSVRWYHNKKVPRHLVDQAILAAAQSPSACNRQPFEFRIFDDPGMLRKVSEIPMGNKGFSHQFPMVVVVVGKLNAYEFERDRHLIYIDGSLAAMSFMLALETLGLSSCSINWPDVEELEIQMDETLRLSSFERPILLLSVGYAEEDGRIPFSHKQPLDRIRRYN